MVDNIANMVYSITTARGYTVPKVYSRNPAERIKEMLKKTVKERIEALKDMHEFIINQDDKELYNIWITYGVPDEPTDETLESIASDISEYMDVKKMFLELVNRWL